MFAANTLPFIVKSVPSNVKLASPSSSVVVEPMVTNLFSALLFSAVIVPPLPPPAVTCSVPSANTNLLSPPILKLVSLEPLISYISKSLS